MSLDWRRGSGPGAGPSSGPGATTLGPGKRTLVESLGEMPQVRRQAADPGSAAESPAGTAKEATNPPAESAPEQSNAPTSKELEAAETDLVAAVGDDSAEAPPTAAGAEPDRNVLEQAVAGAGRPLPADLRASLEATAGHSLTDVRVHDDPAAGQAAQALGARAFTLKQGIHFAPGAYQPGTSEGRRLIAHEVGHTMQPEGPAGAGVSSPDEAVEHEAEAFAGAAAEQQPPRETVPPSGVAPAVAAPPTSVRTKIPRFPGVVKTAFEEDKLRWVNPADHAQGKVWQEDRGYIRNPTSTQLSTVVGAKGKIGGGFDNGKFMYVVDSNGDVWVGKRLGQNMPHPTLIGGKEPQVLGAGMVQIEGGRSSRSTTTRVIFSRRGRRCAPRSRGSSSYPRRRSRTSAQRVSISTRPEPSCGSLSNRCRCSS